MKIEQDYLAKVEEKGLMLRYIPLKHRTAAVCMAAVRENGFAIRYVPKEYQTEEMCTEAARQGGTALVYILERQRTAAVCTAAVQRTGAALRYVPLKQRTVALCTAAVRQNEQALQFVPAELKSAVLDAIQETDAIPKQENDYLEIVRQDGLTLGEIPRAQRTARICLAAVMQNAAAVKYVPAEFGVIPAQEQGKTTITINGKHFSGEFKVLEVETLTPSHDPWTFSPNPAFPCQNDRDYFKDKNAQETVIKMSLAFDDRAFYNFPIVKQEHDKFFVVSGNNRVMSYMRASRYNDYKKYSETLSQAGGGLGFQKPIRIFLLDTQEAVTAKFLSFFNHSDKKEMSVIEKAVSISKILEAESLRRLNEYIAGYETLGDFYASKDSISIFSYLTKETGLLNDLEVGKYFDKRTGVNSEGKTFLETLFIGSIFSADIIRTLNSEGMRTLLNKFIKASVIFASNKQLGKYNIIPYIEKAITVIKQAHLAGFTIEGFTAQQDFFMQRVADDLTLAVIEKLQGVQREFIGFFNMLGKRLLDAYHGESDLILGRPETPAEIIESVFGIKLEPEAIPEPEVVSEPRRSNTRLIFDELIERKERVSLLKETQDKTKGNLFLEQTQNLETYKQERDEYETLLYNTLIFFHSDVESWIQRNPTPGIVILHNKIMADYETSDVDLMEFRQAYAALPTY